MTVAISERARGANDAITECVRKLMYAFAAQLTACEEAGEFLPFNGVGEVIIVVDPKGEVNTANILQRHYDETYPVVFLKVDTSAHAGSLEQLLLAWGYDVDTLHDVIRALEPEYTAPEWSAHIVQASWEISAALLGAIVLEPGSRRYELLKTASGHSAKQRAPIALYANPDELFGSEEGDPEMDGLITEYIGLLLDHYDECLEDPRDDPGKRIGSIRIIVDDGTIAAHVNERLPSTRMLLLCLPTLFDAQEVEYMFAQWAIDRSTLREVVGMFRPNYPDPEFYDHYVDQAIDEIADVFLRAMVIPPNSYMGMQLQKAVDDAHGEP